MIFSPSVLLNPSLSRSAAIASSARGLLCRYLSALRLKVGASVTSLPSLFLQSDSSRAISRSILCSSLDSCFFSITDLNRDADRFLLAAPLQIL